MFFVKNAKVVFILNVWFGHHSGTAGSALDEFLLPNDPIPNIDDPIQ